MDVLENKSEDELHQSLLAELAKAKNELKCAEADNKKAKGRLNFLIVLANELKARKHNR